MKERGEQWIMKEGKLGVFWAGKCKGNQENKEKKMKREKLMGKI